jgi:hypothetical protein
MEDALPWRITVMTKQAQLRRLWTSLMLSSLLMPTWSAVSHAQTPKREGNEYNFKDWQPTRGQVNQEERAAGVGQTPAQRNAEEKELQKIDKDLTRQQQSWPSTQPGNSR